ncbi:sugar transferase [Amnibacterium setariae]|uniref:Sugar transferase n=1 Tax=Amnibacterium setariae TaxID=2306585 RepID=A0A3A1U1J9_9MICO|nr:sugar transferase [Amnibacterium setariae]RIX28336.1 sugar transferase [Amnibacterium setariae]
MTASPITLPATPARTATGRRWSQRLAMRLAATDALVVALTVLVAHLAAFGAAGRAATTSRYAADLPYAVISLGLAVLWLTALWVVDSRDEDEIGTGTTEYRRVIRAGVATLVITIVVGFFLGIDLSRVWASAVVPAGTALLLAGRWGWRRHLMRRRALGLDSHRVVLLGSTSTVVSTALDLARQPGHGYRVVGVALTDGPSEGTVADLRIVGAVDDVPNALRALEADTVIATSSEHLSAERLRDLAWHLDPQQHHLVVAPSITDVGGSRIHLRPVAGLPLIHVETPHQAGLGRAMKRVFDVVVASIALVILAPVLLVVSVLVHRDSPGGVLYRQERIGRDGEPFSILKFRSMTADADVRRTELTAGLGKGLFKMADDPRITRVGRVLRRYSLDELPQLINVLRGEMSLVGPRPALPSEVSEYDRRELRRLAVTPGLSGLWQVSGRSDLEWADGIRLDLYYVENWSMTQDLQILWRTARAVVTSSGAY